MEGRNLIRHAQALLGISKSPKATFQRGRLVYLSIFLLLGNLIILSSMLEAAELFLQLHLAIVAIFYITMAALFIFLVKERHAYDDCLDWCENLNDEYRLKTCADESLGIVKRVFTIVIGIMVAATSESVVKSIYMQRFVPWFPIKLPFMDEEHFLNGLICFIVNFQAATVNSFGMAIVFSSLGMIIKHFIADLDLMKGMLRNAKTDLEFETAVKKVIQLHADLMDRAQIVIAMTNYTILCFEFSTYAALLFVWIIVFHQPSMLFVAGGGVTVFVLFVQLCLICASYSAALEEFEFFVYDLDWYEMSPRSRRTLLQIMVTLKNPKLMMAGPFHPVDYENFTIMLQRVYSYGIGLNNLISLNK